MAYTRARFLNCIHTFNRTRLRQRPTPHEFAVDGAAGDQRTTVFAGPARLRFATEVCERTRCVTQVLPARADGFHVVKDRIHRLQSGFHVASRTSAGGETVVLTMHDSADGVADVLPCP